MSALAALFDLGGFAEPGRLPLLLALAALAIATGVRRRPPTLAWPALPEARLAGARRRDPVRLAALALRFLALASLAAALAEPRARSSAAPLETPGIDVVLAVDASASMRALDVSDEGATRTRLALAREAVARFASQRAAAGDRVALVLFGETAFTQVPLTRDGRMLEAALARVEPGVAGEATALGDALALAVRRALAGVGAAPEAAAGPGEGRVVVLLSDGRSNAGGVPVDVATALALRAGVRVHTVAIGTQGDVPVAAPGGGLRWERHDVDPATLERVARATGGRFFAARSSHDLGRVYAAIDGLERVPRALPAPAGAPRPEPWLAAAGLLLAAELALARVLFRRLP